MPDPVTGTVGALAGGQVVSGVFGNKAADKQIGAQREASALNERVYDESQKRIQDFLGGADVNALRDFIGTESPSFNPTSFNDFSKSKQAQQGITNTSRRALNAFSGMGNFGSTGSLGDLIKAQGNTLNNLYATNRANELDDFNNQRLARSDKMNELLKLVNIGQSATGQQNTLGQNFAQTQGANLSALGQMQAGKAAIPGQVLQGLLNTGATALAPTDMGGLNIFG